MKKIAYAGSFDPWTNGHQWMVDQASNLFDEVVVLLASNVSKKTYFSEEERRNQITQANLHNPKIKVHTLPQSFVVDYCKMNSIEFVLRGIRNNTDFEYENQILQINEKINPKVQTWFLVPPSSQQIISSSMVKSLVGFPSWQSVVEPLVSPVVVSDFIKKLYLDKIKMYRGSLSDEMFNDLVERYSQPHRFYHNLQHLLELFTLADDASQIVSLTMDEKNALSLAIWFHDAVYEPLKSDNEDLSNQLFEEYAKQNNLGPQLTKQVSLMILSTKDHLNQPPLDNLTSLFLDLDLAILGSSHERFMEYDGQISKEYRQVPPEMYAQGRKAILTKFLNLTLYRGYGMKWEQLAKENLKKILD